MHVFMYVVLHSYRGPCRSCHGPCHSYTMVPVTLTMVPVTLTMIPVALTMVPVTLTVVPVALTMVPVTLIPWFLSLLPWSLSLLPWSLSLLPWSLSLLPQSLSLLPWSLSLLLCFPSLNYLLNVQDAIYSGVAAGLVLFTSFIPAAAYAAQFQAFASQVTNEIGQNIITTSIGVSGTLAVRLCALHVDWYAISVVH